MSKRDENNVFADRRINYRDIAAQNCRRTSTTEGSPEVNKTWYLQTGYMELVPISGSRRGEKVTDK